MSAGTEVSVILPTRNERETVEFLLYALGAILTARLGDRYELVVVDDSTDDSFEDLERRLAGTPGEERIRLHHRERGTGLATAIEFGIGQAMGEYLAVMDADFNHNPNDVLRMLDAIADCDLVVGSRFVAGGGMIDAKGRETGSRVFNHFARRALGVDTHDNLSGFWVMRRQALAELATGSDLFQGYGDYFMRMLYKAKRSGVRITEIPVVYFGRLSGESKTRFGRDLVRYARTILELRRQGS